MRQGHGLAASSWNHVVSGLWLGLAVGLASGLLSVTAHVYLDLGLRLNAVREITSAVVRDVLGAMLLCLALALVVSCARLLGRHGRWLAWLVAGLGAAALLQLALTAADRLSLGPAERLGAVVASAVALVAGLRGGDSRRLGAWWAMPALLVVLLLVVADQRFSAAAARRAAGRPNVLVLLVDALRPDHLGCHGYRRDTSPTIDGLARRGMRFTNVIAPSNKTRTTMPSVWTGLWPSRHGVFRREDVLSPRFTTVAERLVEAGYRTAAFCPNPSLDRIFGHGQGWETYDDDFSLPIHGDEPAWLRFETAERIHERALAWLDGADDRPFLMWLHYRDVHGPYVPPPTHEGRFPLPPTPRPLTPEEREALPAYLTRSHDGDDLNTYLAHYDAEIRYTDDRISELLGELDRRGVLDQTIVIVTADHGEAFLEHGQWSHGVGLHAEEVRVPLIVTGGDVVTGVSGDVVSLVDLFPTILQLAGAPVPPSDGYTLLPVLTGRAERHGRRFALSEADDGDTHLQRAWTEGRHRLLASWATGSVKLFDVVSDPGELVDLAGREPEIGGRLWERMRELVRQLDVTGRATATADVDDALREQLEALGYVK